MKQLFPTALLFFLLFHSCKNDPSTVPTAEPLMVDHQTIAVKEGDCDQPDYDSKCANVSLTYPVIKNGNDTLTGNVAAWAEQFMIGILDPGIEGNHLIKLDSAIQEFILMHNEITMDMPDMPAYYTVEITDTLLMQNESHLTLRLDAYSFTGGAHPNSFAAVTTFDIKSGRQLLASDFVTDLKALETIAEAKFRQEKAEAFAEGFDFDESWPFKLADNIGLTQEGLLFCYIPYEVGPYVMGFTEFVIPFSELEAISK